MTTAEAERTFSTLKRIKTFLRNTMLNDRLNALVMISINRNLVHQINNFDDKHLAYDDYTQLRFRAVWIEI
nr:unnamed protein product [Callosobruchus chinensis]